MAYRELSLASLTVVQEVEKSARSLLDRGYGDNDPVRIGCSGGADSMALTAAISYLIRRGRWSLGDVDVVVVDHQLQANSDQISRDVAERIRLLGCEVTIATVEVNAQGQGIEAAARQARYQALFSSKGQEDNISDNLDLPSRIVATAHTMNDQAETVLMGLGRGSGIRSMSGMAEFTEFNIGDLNLDSGISYRGYLWRPLLNVTRENTRQACKDWGIEIWDDPHNLCEDFTRVQVRNRVIPALEECFGSSVIESLSRTAAMARCDADELDAQARRLPIDQDRLPIDKVIDLPIAIGDRIIRRWVISVGADQPSYHHIQMVRSLIDHWHGQGPIPLPGGIKIKRVKRFLLVENG